MDGNRELLDQRIPVFPHQPVRRLEKRIDPVQHTNRARVIGHSVNLVRLLLRKILHIDRIGSSLIFFAVAESILIRVWVVGIRTNTCLLIIC